MIRTSATIIALTILSACADPARNTTLAAGASGQSTQARPASEASPIVAVERAEVAAPVRAHARSHPGIVLVNETFANTSTPANAWFYSAGVCLTAGTASQPPGSIPACGSSAPQDPPGAGALQLVVPTPYTVALVGWNVPLPTAHGLDIQFTSYSFDGTGADGTLLFFTDGSFAAPSAPGSDGGCLGYLGHATKGEYCGKTGLTNAYLGVGLDEFGDFSKFLDAEGKHKIPQTVALGGAATELFPYLGGVLGKNGEPGHLPFDLDQPAAQTRPTNAPTVDVTLTAAGALEVSIDIHDGKGLVTYLSENVVGIRNQPAVPATVYVGFTGSNGGYDERRQIGDVTISTLQ